MSKLPKQIKETLSIHEAANLLKVSDKTLRRWEAAGKLVPVRTSGGHRRYQYNDVIAFKKNKKNKVVGQPTWAAANPIAQATPVIAQPEAEVSSYFASLQQPRTEESPIFADTVISPKPEDHSTIQTHNEYDFADNLRKEFFDKVHTKKIVREKIKLHALVGRPQKRVLVYASGAFMSLAIVAVISKHLPAFNTVNVAGDQTRAAVLAQSKVLADTSIFQNLTFAVNIPAEFNGGSIQTQAESFDLLTTVEELAIGNDTGTVSFGNDVDLTGSLAVGTDADVSGTLNIGGTLTADDDLVIDATGGGVSIGTGTANSVDLTGDDLFVSGDIEVDGAAYLTSIVLNGETITDFSGDGITVSGGALTAALGTSITTGEITNDTILAQDLDVTNDPTDGYSLTYDSATGGFSWTEVTGTQLITTEGGTGATSSPSGLELISGKLGLLQGCSDSEILKWDETAEEWSCSLDAGAGGTAIINVQNNDVSVGASVDTVDFSSDFSVTASPSNEANISIADDIVNFTELADALTLDAATTITNGLSGNFTINLSSTGDFTVADNGSVYATFTDGGAFILDSLTFDGQSITSSADIIFDDGTLSSSISLTDSDTGFTSGDTAIVDAINTAYNAATGGSGGVFTRSAGLIYPTTTTDNMTIGSNTSLAKLGVDGDTDEVQLLIQGNATQTNNVLVVEQSDGDDIMTLDDAGNLDVAGSFQAGSINGLSVTSSGAVTADSFSDGTLTIQDGIIDFGTNTITDGVMTGNWNFSGGNLTNIANVSATGTVTFTNLTTDGLVTTASGVLSSTATIGSSYITDNSLTASDLSATLTFSDGDLINLSAINTSSTTEGLILPQNTTCSAGTAEGQICWDSDSDQLAIGNGSGITIVGAGTFNSFTLSGDSGSDQTISDSNTLEIAGGTNGIDTVASATDTITLNLDTTEIGTTTFGSGSAITWTFDASAGTDTTIAFGNDTMTLTAGTVNVSGNADISGTLTAGTADAFTVSSTGAITAITNETINGIDVNAGAISDVTNLTINSGGDLTIGSIGLNDVGTDNITSGASLVGVFDEFTYSASTTVQDVLDDLDAQIASLGGSAYTGWTLAGTSGTPQTISSGDTATFAAGTGITTTASATDTLTIAATLGTDISSAEIVDGTIVNGDIDAAAAIALSKLASGTSAQIIVADGSGVPTYVDMTGDVAISTTGATTIQANSVALATDTTGNYIATITGNTQVGVSGSGSENAGVTLSINADSLTTSQLSATLTFSDGDLIDLSSINNSSTSEGLRLPQATSCSAATAEGQICWDSDSDQLAIGNGSGITTLGTGNGTMSSFTLSGDSGSDQTISDSNTLEIAGGTNGIDTVASATDTITLNLDTTEMGTTTFGSGSGFTWTFDAGATDPTIAFASDSITLSTATVTGATILNGSATIGDAGDAIAISGTTVTLASNGAGNDVTLTSVDDFIVNIADNGTNSFDLQQGGNDYININTTNTTENIAFGNTTTNPSFSFLGSGTATFTGSIVASTAETINGVDINAGTVSDVVNLTINSGGDLTIGSIGLNDVGTDNITSGASLVGVFDEFTYSASTTVQDVLDDLDAQIASLGGSAYTGWTIDGDDADTQAIDSGNTLLVAGGTNGIDTDVSATDTITLNLDTTEIGTTTFGSGSGFTWTFDAGTTDPTIAFADNALTFTAGTVNTAGNADISGTLTSGTANAFTVSATGVISTITDETINGIDISAGSISDVVAITATTGNITTVDLGSNTITDGNFNGDWAFNSGNLSGITALTATTGNLTTLDLGTNTITDGNLTGDWTITGGDLTLGTGGTDGSLTIYNELGATDYSVIFQVSGSQTETTTYTLPANNGDADQVLVTDGSGVLTWTTVSGIGGVGDITAVVAGTGATGGATSGSATIDVVGGNGLTANADDIAIDLLDSADGTGATSSNSGLEFAGSGSDELSLIQGCSDGQVLSWNNGTNVWECTSVSGIGGVGDITSVVAGNGLTDGGTSGDVTLNIGEGTAIDVTADAVSFDSTELGTTTFGSGSAITWTFDASAGTDTTIAFGNNTITATAGTFNVAGNLDASGTFAVGTADALTIDASGNLATTGTLTAATNETINGIDISAGTVTDVVNLTINSGGDLTIGSIGLNDVGTSNTDSGASLVGVFDEFANSASTTVQDVLDDLDAAISTGSFTSITLSGDSGSDQTLSSGDTLEIAGGTNGIDTVASATDTLTINLDTTEIGSTTFGSGSGFTWTFDAGATDPTIAFASDALTLTAGTSNFSGNVDISGTLTAGTANAFTVSATGVIATITDETINGIDISAGSISDVVAITATTGNITTVDLGTNTITDGNFNGNWAYNSGNISGVGTLGLSGAITGATNETINGIDINAGAISDVTNLTINSGGDLTIGSIGLNDVGSDNVTSGASLVGTFDEFTYSTSTTVQDVLDDLDAQIGTLAGSAYAGWTISDGTTSQAIDSTNTLTVADSSTVNATVSATDTLTLNVIADSVNFTELADSLSLDVDTSIAAGAGLELTYNKTFTDATSENGMVLNFTALDTTAGTTAQYGLYLDNVTSTEGLDASLVIDNSDADDAVAAAIKVIDAGGGFTNIFDIAGTLISGTELGRLDGKDAALVDTNDAVATAITGTGALNSGSITSGFGAIDLGNDTFTTTGAITGGSLTIGSIGLEDLGSDNITSGASLVGVFDEFTNSASTTVQDVLDDLDAAIVSGAVSLTLSGDSGSDQTISNNDTIEIAGGTNGIDTVASATDTITINLDTTEIGTTTFGSGSGITWTFDASAGTDTTLAFGNGTLSYSGDLTVAGGDLTGANAEFIDLGEADNGSFIFTASGETNNGSLELDLETNTIPTFESSTATAIGFDEDLQFIGAQSITTTTGDLTINSGGTLQISDNTDIAGTLAVGTADAFTVSATGVIVTVTDETINGIDINSGAISDVTNLTASGTITFSGLNTDGLVTVSSGVLSSAATIGSSYITDDSLTAADLSATLTFADGDLINLSAINNSSTTEGLILPQANACTSATAEGQICWDADSDTLAVGDGTGIVTFASGGGTMSSFTLSGDSGSDQTISDSNTLEIAGGTNGIDTVASATDTITINLDTTEIGSTTFGSGSGFTWTFDAGATDPTIAFASDAVTLTAATTTLSGDLAINGGNITTGVTFDSTATVTGTFTANGQVVIGDGGDTVAINSSDWDISTGGNMTGIGSIAADGGMTLTKSISADSGTTNNVQAITLTTPADTTGTNIHQGLNIATTLGDSSAGTNTVNVINLDAITGDPQVNLNGVKIGNLTGSAATEYALNIGSGWDSVLRVNGTEVINGSGQVAAGQLTGTILNTAADSGTSTLVQGDTLTLSGGTNGINTSLSGDTYTLNLDTTEIGTTTFGSGSGITWTFDAGATDPTIAFASDALTLTAGTVNVAGNVDVSGTLTAGTADAFTVSGTGVIATITDETINGIDISAGSISDVVAITATTGNITTVDLGTNTITDGNFNGNWAFNSGNLSGIGTLSAAGAITSTNGFTTNSETVTDFSGTGITVTGGALTASLGTSIAGSEVDDDTLDYVDFEDTMDLDAALTLNQSTNTWTQNFSGTTTDGLTYNANSLTSGDALVVSSTSTALTTGRLGVIDWSPGSATTASGDLFQINIGSNGTTTGNLLNITDNGSTLFSVSETAITANLPTSFTAAGDVSMAYDLVLTNQTASLIKSKAPLTIEAGESFENNDLTLTTYGTGDVIINPSGTGALVINGLDCTGNTSGGALTASATGVISCSDDDGGAAGITTLTLSGDTGSDQTITDTNTIEIAGGTNGIDTVGTATDSVVINLDTTEIGASTFGSGSGFAWTFNAGATDPVLTFASNALTIGSAATITATDVTAFNCTDCLNFDDIADSATLDAATDFNLSTFAFTIDMDSTGDFSIRDGSTDILAFTDSGAITATPTSGQNFGVTVAGTGDINLTLATGQLTATSSNVTGTTTSAGFIFDATAITSGTGLYMTSDSITTGTLLDLSTTGVTQTTGTLLNVSSVGSAFAETATTGGGLLADFNWNPGSGSTTGTGDLVRIRLDDNGTLTSGNLLNIVDESTSIFSVSETAVTTSLPTSFTAAGDVAVAYDMQFTNQTSSYIKSNAPLYIQAGEIFENNNLNLQTYGSGNIVADAQGTGYFMVNGTSTSVVGTTATNLNVAGAYILSSDLDTITTLIRNANTGAITMQNVGTAGAQGDPGVLTIEGAGSSTTAYNLITAYNSTTRSDAAAVFRVRADGNVYGEAAFNSSGADVAEYFAKEESIADGELVGLNPATNKARRYQNGDTLLGAKSVKPGFVGNRPSGLTDQEIENQYVLVGLLGQVPVNVDPTSASINVGDYITGSAISGYGSKLTGSGHYVGRAIQSWTQGSSQESVMVLVSPDYHYDAVAEAQGGSSNSDPLNGYITVDEQGTSTLAVDKINTTDLVVLGDTTLSDTVINGELTIGGINFDNTNNSIDAVGTLRIQPMALGVVEFMNGLITFDTQGNVEVKEITAEKYNVAGASAGTATMAAGDTIVTVPTTAVTENSLIFITPKRALAYPMAVTTKTNGVEFTVEISVPELTDVEFDWFIVDKVSQN